MRLGAAMPEAIRPARVVCPIRDDGDTSATWCANRAGARPIDPRERELLEMLSEYLAVAIHNSRLYGEVAETKQSLERLICSAGTRSSPSTPTAGSGVEPRRRPHLRLDDAGPHRPPARRPPPRGAVRNARASLSREHPVSTFEVTSKRARGVL